MKESFWRLYVVKRSVGEWVAIQRWF
jgi:hypothetical protein